MMHDLMIDLETMGKGNKAAIVEIGAVFFDPILGTIGNSFCQKISLESSVGCGLEIDTSTVLWWMMQSEQARARLTSTVTVDLPDALDNFYRFINETSEEKWVKPWGNGASFDLVILSNAYRALNWADPWRFYNERDVRTVVSLGQMTGFDPKKEMPFEGVKHSALDDAIHQAKYVSAIIQRLTKG